MQTEITADDEFKSYKMSMFFSSFGIYLYTHKKLTKLSSFTDLE